MRAAARLSIRPAALLRACCCALGLVLGAASAAADESCRIAFDLGSSGIRAGASASRLTTRADIDYLAPLLAGRGLQETEAATIDALHDLPAQGGFAGDCAQVGGGFSVWRLALAKDAGGLSDLLARLRAASGVAVLVIPPQQEGAYAYYAAQRALGRQLASSHVLDIGGGSLQIAGAQSSYVDTLGQKVWQRELCRNIRQSANASALSAPCVLQPLSGDELARARALLAQRLAGVAAALPPAVTMTAISRPLTRGVKPALARLFGGAAVADGIRLTTISAAIEQLAGLGVGEAAALLGIPVDYAGYLLSDLLLVEGLLQATHGETLHVAEVDLSNVPGLLADERAFRWRANYACYLERLRSSGLEAYASDPQTCSAAK